MKTVYFETDDGRKKIYESEEISDEKINELIRENTIVKNIPYQRMWKPKENETYIDYGSWSHFFVIVET